MLPCFANWKKLSKVNQEKAFTILNTYLQEREKFSVQDKALALFKNPKTFFLLLEIYDEIIKKKQRPKKGKLLKREKNVLKHEESLDKHKNFIILVIPTQKQNIFWFMFY